MRLRLGKKPPLVDARTLELAMYVKPELPAAPGKVDYGAAVTRWPMYANDRYADCTCAAAGHMIQTWRTNSGTSPRKPTTRQIVQFYSYFTTPGPENALEMLSVLRHWHAAGLAGYRIQAFATLRTKNAEDLKNSVYLFGGCYIGVVLPKFVTSAADISQPHWSMRAEGKSGEGAPDPDGGHCIPAVGYDTENVYVVTWGALKKMSWDFYAAYSDEAYAVLSADFLKDERTVQGFDRQQLIADVRSRTGGRGVL